MIGHRSRRRGALAALGAITAGALLAGCSADTGAATAESAPVSRDIAVDAGAPASAEGAPAANGTVVATTGVQRQVIRTGSVSLRSSDVARTASDIRAAVARAGGVIATEDSQSTDQSAYATITAQVPADRLDRFIADISALGTVDSISLSAQDVSSQAVDLDARIAALRTSIDRLTTLLSQASRMEDLLAIETQLSQRQSELDSLSAQRAYLADQVALSAITVSVSPLGAVPGVDAPGFLSGVLTGWAALVSMGLVAVTALGFLLPFLIALLIIAIPAVIVLVRHARRSRRSSAVASASGDEDPGAHSDRPGRELVDAQP